KELPKPTTPTTPDTRDKQRTKEGQHPTPVTVAQPLFSQTNFPQSFSLLLYFGVNHQPPIDLRNLIGVVYRVWWRFWHPGRSENSACGYSGIWVEFPPHLHPNEYF